MDNHCIYIVQFKLLYLLQGIRYQCPIITTLYHTISLHINIFWCPSQAWCQRYKIRYLMCFKTTTPSGRSVKIALLICSVHKFLSYPLLKYCCEKLMHNFVPIILANQSNSMYGENYWTP